MSDLNNNWFEVWYVNGVGIIPAYLVIVTPNPDKNDEIIVLDLQENKVLYSGKSYQDVHEWLTEDEFSFINGRIYED